VTKVSQLRFGLATLYLSIQNKALLAELVDAPDLKSGVRKSVSVRVRQGAPDKTTHSFNWIEQETSNL
jgi:hypothetical protein